MSLTRLAGGRSSSAFFAKSTRPSGSTTSADSALTATGRPLGEGGTVCADASRGADMTASATRTARATGMAIRRVGCTGGHFSQRRKPPARRNPPSADRLLQLLRRLETGHPAADGDGLARPRILHRARLAARNGERAEADEGHGVAALERGTHAREHGPDGAFGRRLRPARGLRHPHDEVRL